MRCPDRDKEAKTQFVVDLCVPKLHLCVSEADYSNEVGLTEGVITTKAPVSSLTVSWKHPCAALGVFLGVVTV